MPKIEKIAEWLSQQSEPKYRLQQVRAAWYKNTGWDSVTTLSPKLRQQLQAEFPWMTIKSARVVESQRDHTKKALLTLADDLQIETVYMPNARGSRTVCVSSQVGCAMACAFCATGSMGWRRNLTADEIIDQARFWRQTERGEINNIVFMGMGEPLANYDAVKYAAQTFIKDFQIGPTRLTISTVGIPAGLKRLLSDADFPPVRIAISLHAGTDQTRAKLVPTHQQQSMRKIVDWIDQYLRHHKNRRQHITLEYVMIGNQNDSPQEARALVKLFRPYQTRIKLNLIPWNYTNSKFQHSTAERLAQFSQITKKGGITTLVRDSKGLDIQAACGQLAAQHALTRR